MLIYRHRDNILTTPQETGAVGLQYLYTVNNGLPLFDTDNMCFEYVLICP